MNTLNELQTLVLLVAGFSAIFGFIFDAIYRVVKAQLDKGKPLIITLPGTVGALATVSRKHLDEGQTNEKKGDEGKTWVAAGPAAYPSSWGPIHILTDYGANLIAPSKEEVAQLIEANDGGASQRLKNEDWKDEAEKDLLQRMVLKARIAATRFLVWDPLLLWRSNRENDMEDLYSSAGEKDPWYARAMPILVLLLLGFMAFSGFLIWKVLPLLAHRGG